MVPVETETVFVADTRNCGQVREQHIFYVNFAQLNVSASVTSTVTSSRRQHSPEPDIWTPCRDNQGGVLIHVATLAHLICGRTSRATRGIRRNIGARNLICATVSETGPANHLDEMTLQEEAGATCAAR
jgi:hypothetical protein